MVLGTGNEAVLQARFEDAQFFYNSDLRQPLEAFIPKLEGTQFHRSLGNLLQKTERVQQLIAPLAEACGLSGQCVTCRVCSPPTWIECMRWLDTPQKIIYMLHAVAQSISGEGIHAASAVRRDRD